jgi:hypothetical protein
MFRFSKLKKIIIITMRIDLESIDILWMLKKVMMKKTVQMVIMDTVFKTT